MRNLAALVLALAVATAPPAWPREVGVADAKALAAALRAARPGDRIVLGPGLYRPGKTVIARPGTADAPITLTASAPAATRIETNLVELFKVRAPWWVFENLFIAGGAGAHHAFHIVGPAHHVTLRHNKLVGFHAAVKANPEHGAAADAVTVEGNILYNEAPRETDQPVTTIDVVGGRGWVIRGNFIADFAKAGGDRISYAAFLKGNGKGGLIEDNLVQCEWKHRGGFRVGLSFGGGGSFGWRGPADPPEHTDGVMRNNIIANCPRAPGIYINRARKVRIVNNTLYRAFGIVARFAETRAEVVNNIVSGAVAARRDAGIEASNNLETGWSWGVDIPGGALHAKRNVVWYGSKYPSLVDGSELRWINARIDDLATWLSASFVGRGDAQAGRWFRDARADDFTLADGADIVGRGKAHPDAPEDFCGHFRKGAFDLGAIQYAAGPCDVQAWRESLFRRFE